MLTKTQKNKKKEAGFGLPMYGKGFAGEVSHRLRIFASGAGV
jgi:hypothetical protein